jgi:hypothetical protein
MKKIIALITLLPLLAAAQNFNPYVHNPWTTNNPSALPQPSSVVTNTDPNYLRGAMAVTNWSEAPTYYVSPIYGNDTNSGVTRATPFQTYPTAANWAYSNAPATIVLMAGTNYFPGTGWGQPPYQTWCFIVPPLVNLVGESGNLVLMNNTNASGNLNYAGLQTSSTNTINGVNFEFDSPISSDVPLGNFGTLFASVAYSAPTIFPNIGGGLLNIHYFNCSFKFQGTGIHFESGVDTNLYTWSFDSCKFLCNNNWIQHRDVGAILNINNCEVWLQSWTNNKVVNPKPLRLLETRTVSGAFPTNFPVRIRNTIIHYSDADLSNSNRPAYIIWNTQNTTNGLATVNEFLMQNVLLEALSITNPASVDLHPTGYNTQTNCVLVLQNVSRTDNGGLLTTNIGEPVSILNHW